jgi:hypothetical protein
MARAALWSLLLWLATPQRSARAEDSLTYKFQSWQEDNGRVKVDAHYAQAETTLSTDTRLKLVGLIDTISGATPSGQPAPNGSDQVPLSNLTDRREAVQFEVSQPIGRMTLSGGYSKSSESDYVSHAWSLNTLTDFNQKNTTLLVGYGRADDEIIVSFLPQAYTKSTDDFIVGVTQLLSPTTVLTANLTYGQADGYLSDPYKIIEQTTEILPGISLDLTFPENRPTSKKKWIAYFGLNRSYAAIDGALESSYRFLDDNWGTTSHTVELAWFQRFGGKFIVRPAVRFYQQSASDIYHVDLNGSSITATNDPTGMAPYYSSDYRLSALRTWMVGIKAVWEIKPWCSVDATVERYIMQGRDHVTSASAYADANVFTIGFRLWR